MWNSGRLASITATTSPGATPSSRNPSAKRSTRSPYSAHVSSRSPPRVRSATRSGACATVRAKASATVSGCSPFFEPSACTAVLCIALSLPCGRGSAGVEAAAREAADVVREADHEQEHHEHEADHAGLLHDPERDRPPAHLLDQAPEDVAAVERQEGEQVYYGQRQADHRQQRERAAGVEGDRLAGHLVASHHA